MAASSDAMDNEGFSELHMQLALTLSRTEVVGSSSSRCVLCLLILSAGTVLPLRFSLALP